MADVSSKNAQQGAPEQVSHNDVLGEIDATVGTAEALDSRVAQELREELNELADRLLGDVTVKEVRDFSRRFENLMKTLVSEQLGLDAVLEKFKFKINEDGSVRYTKPKGFSDVEVLLRVQEQWEALGKDGHAISPSALNWLKSKREHTRPATEDTSREIIGVVEGTRHKSWREAKTFVQEQGLEIPTPGEALIAHAMLRLQTGLNLFSDDVKPRVAVGTSVRGIFLHEGSERYNNNHINGARILTGDLQDSFVGMAGRRPIKSS